MASVMAAAMITSLPVKAGATSYLDDRTLTFIIASGAGSGTDRAARLFAAYLARHLSDTSVAPVNNARAAGQIAASELWQAPSDGLTVGILPSNSYYNTLLDPEPQNFEFENFSFVGSMTRPNRVLVASSASGIESMADLYAMDRPVIVAANTTISSHYYEALFLNAILGTRLLPVPGFSGGARNMAVISGEADCQIGSLEGVQPILDAGAGRVIMVLTGGSLPPLMPEPVSLRDEAAGQPNEWIVDVIDGASSSGRLIAGPPDMPVDRLIFLRDLFDQIVADPAFVEQAAAVGMVVNPSSGDQIQQQLASIFERGSDRLEELLGATQCGLRIAETGTAC